MCAQSNRNSEGRLEYLDSLRGVGAVVVALCHFDTFFPLIGDEHLFNGAAAVGVFFVLSAYVLSLRLRSLEGLRTFSLPNFIVRRFFRLWMPFTAAVLLALLLHKLLPTSDLSSPPFYAQYVERWTGYVSPGMVIEQLWRFYSPDLLAPSWSLRPEFINSLLLPPAMLLLLYRPTWFIFGLVLGGYYGIFPFGGLHFGLGALLAVYQEQLVTLAKVFKLALLGPVTFIVVYVLNPQHLGPLGPDGLWAPFSALLLLSMLASGALQKVAVRFVPRMLGKASFAIYLLHWPLMFVVAPPVFEIVEPSGLPVWIMWFMVALIFLATTFLLSVVFYILVEKPSISIGKIVGRFAARQNEWLFGKLSAGISAALPGGGRTPS